jgi:hypothetical protein
MRSTRKGDEHSLKIFEDKDELWLWRPSLSLFLNLVEKKGEARLNAANDWETVLRVIYFYSFLSHSGLLLHASGVVRQDQAFVFPGPSGAGKTTIVLHSLDQAILSDEMVLVQMTEAGVTAHGTPFSGEWGQPGMEISAPLKGLYFPVHDRENRLVPLAPYETLTRLLPCVCTYTTRVPLLEKVFKLATEISQLTQGYALHFRPFPDFWPVLDAS